MYLNVLLICLGYSQFDVGWMEQVTDERTVQEGTGGDQRVDTDVLVRFFGTYD